MSKSLEGAWAEMLSHIRKQISPQSYETWLAPTKQVAYSDNSITVEVPNAFFKDWITEHYRDDISRAAEEFGQKELDVQFIVDEAAAKNPLYNPSETDKRGGSFFARAFEKFTQPTDFVFNPRYTFDTFVVYDGNRFTHAASLAVAEKLAKEKYNPLFVYGGAGLGKTHLMQAIGQYAMKKHPRLKVSYVSSEKFTNQLINAIQNRTTQKFRDRYRFQDILLIDDIQFLSGKESTQEEFFHTFNELHEANKQIVVSSDKPPKEIPALESRLVSRFGWGLVTDIQPPSVEGRVAILRKKAEMAVVNIPDDVLFFIADNIKSNIRELEGALVRVVAYSSLVGQKIDLGMAGEVLKEFIVEKNINITVEYIQKTVAEYFGINSSDMRTKKRTKNVVYPRQVAMYLARELTRLPLVEIGGFFGGKDHTTIIHACDKIGEDIKRDPHIRNIISKVTTKIKLSK